MKLKNLNGI